VRLARVCILAASVSLSGLSRADSFEDRVEALFRPPLAERIALSPDGHRVAYTTKSGGTLAIVMITLEPPGVKQTVKLDGTATGDPLPMHLRFLRWATPSRLVFAPAERVVPLPPLVDETGRSVPNPDGPTIISPILAMDADGRQRGTLVDASQFQETPADARRTLADLLRTTKELQATRNEPLRWKMPHLEILGFFPGDREQLVVQTHGGYSIPRQHLVDIRTGTVREFGGDWPMPPSEPQVFDWHRRRVVGERKPAARPTTAWLDGELGSVQGQLEAKFPRRGIEILDWSETRARVLFRVTGGSDPGRVFVFQRPEDLVLEILRVAPWLNASKLNESRFLEFDAPDRARLSGYVTWPGSPRVNPPPLLVIFPSGFPGRAQLAFDPEAQVFADMGFVVARLNHRAVSGVRPEDLASLRTAVDRVSVEDARLTIERIASQFAHRPFDRRRVATLGRGFGGYLALRALQLQPAMFRRGIAIDAPLELRTWLPRPEAGGMNVSETAGQEIPATLLDHAGVNWKKTSVTEHAELLTNPVFLLVERRRSPAIDVSTDALRARLESLGRAPDYLEVDSGFAAAEPASRAAVYRRIQDFLNLHLRPEDVKTDFEEESK
jgi:dipeptidyl aminopeptidase/acylaminoacyl peptidase